MIYIVLKVLLGVGGEKDKRRVSHGLGWWGPEMQPHWHRLGDDVRSRRFGPASHSFVNVGTEWVRLDAQRAVKLAVDIMLVMALAIVVMAL